MDNKEENMILKAYRENNNKGTINIEIKAHTFGFELYRICLMLLNKIMTWEFKDKQENKQQNINLFFDKMKEDYYNFYERYKINE